MNRYLRGVIEDFLLGDVRATSLDRLRSLHELEGLVDEFVLREVSGAREDGASWGEIGEKLGVSKQAAAKRFVPLVATLGGSDVRLRRAVKLRPWSASDFSE
jgi:hypothetical protein